MSRYNFRVTYSDGYSTDYPIESSHPNSAFREVFRIAAKHDRDAHLAASRWIVRVEHTGRGEVESTCACCGHLAINSHCIECGQDANPHLCAYQTQGLTPRGFIHKGDE